MVKIIRGMFYSSNIIEKLGMWIKQVCPKKEKFFLKWEGRGQEERFLLVYFKRFYCFKMIFLDRA